MRFWDSSAIAPLLVRDRFSERIREIHAKDPAMTVWCLSDVEAWSAVTRRRHEGSLESPDIRAARDRLKQLAETWVEITDFPAVARRARRLLEVHRVRASDALQIGAALYAVGDAPDQTEFVTFDDRLAECVEKEGFRVAGIEPP